jgi:hypothetical protein
MAMNNLLNQYRLSARAEGLSPKTIDHVCRVVGFFEDFLGGIDDVRKVSADDLRRFIVALQLRPRYSGIRQGDGRSLSATSINTYARWDKKEIPEDIRIESLTDEQTRDLNRLKDWLYHQRVKARLERGKAERKEKREEAEAKRKEEQPVLFKFKIYLLAE